MKKDIRTLAALLIASATFVACSSDNDIIGENQQPVNPTGKYTMTINASKGDGALTLNDHTLNATWATTENVYVQKGSEWATGSLQPQEVGVTTTLKGELSGITINANENLTLQFPKSGDITYTGQVGTLADIAANFDYATATVKVASISASGNINPEAATTTFTNQQAIIKFTLKDKGNSDAAISPSALTVTDGTSTVELTSIPAATYTANGADNVLYVAFPAAGSAKTVTLTATVGDDTYTYEKSGVTFTNGQYYEITVKMTKQAPAPADPLATPLTLEALEAGNIVVNIMNIIGGSRAYVYPGSRKRVRGGGESSNISMKYSVNGGEKTTIYETTTIDVNAGDKVQLYGNGPDISNLYVPHIAGGTAQVKVYGNIMSLLDEDNYATLTTLQDIAFYALFAGNANLTDASGLLLPATTLAGVWCYYGMFLGCTSLTTAPALPATELAGQCYNYMFSGCTSLTTAPALPATTLAEGCYNGMFSGCTSLTTAPALPATTLVDYCYSSMFYGCTNLNSITCLATEGINENESTSDWVNGVASTGTFNKAIGATWPTGNNGIPSGWTVNEQ